MAKLLWRLGCVCFCLSTMLSLGQKISGQGTEGTVPAPSSPIHLTLQDALARAKQNSAVFQGSVTDAAIAKEEKNQVRDALLPTVAYNNSIVYSQGNGPGSTVRFIANNAVHEYLSQGDVHGVLDVAAFAQYRAAAAAL